ncbi:hypothetical protein P280DRAFT_521965 [Massarina eburnea CBS 473.64]|uniref:Uncharacterized protein n=1 Tax=Massarina eburnea CBS 473.64 TaxID=1395130 RepID=A0A6A6RNB4_9PLEO|nr:hypothetical protein P280DRAFT_521965 [Massarina eburnea CBS 473.64]
MAIPDVSHEEDVDSEVIWDQARSNDFPEEREATKTKLGLGEDASMPAEMVLLSNRIFALILRSRKWACA